MQFLKLCASNHLMSMDKNEKKIGLRILIVLLVIQYPSFIIFHGLEAVFITEIPYKYEVDQFKNETSNVGSEIFKSINLERFQSFDDEVFMYNLALEDRKGYIIIAHSVIVALIIFFIGFSLGLFKTREERASKKVGFETFFGCWALAGFSLIGILILNEFLIPTESYIPQFLSEIKFRQLKSIIDEFPRK